jgi:enoyl-CoA hydratase
MRWQSRCTMHAMSHETILYRTDGPIATITLNRPEAPNTIVPPMPNEVEDAVHTAVQSDTSAGGS